MATNPDGNIEIHPGPRGYSVVSAGVTADGKSVRFTTDEPRTLNPVRMPDGPQGAEGPQGVPGRSAVRVENADNGGRAGYRVYQWDPTLQAEQLVYGDTGVLDVGAGVLVRRTMVGVETTATDPSTLPAGFRPAITGAIGFYTTADPWPEDISGYTTVTPPVPMYGLQAYDADRASGYPGTVEQWLQDSYRVVLPPAGTVGQVLTRTAEGSAWVAPPAYGPKPWESITLESTWQPVTGSAAQVRESAGTVECFGLLSYVGPTVTAGAFSGSFVRVGVMPPAYAPAHSFDIPITSYRASDHEPHPARLVVNEQGVVSIAAFALGADPAAFTLRAGTTQANLSALSYALRNSSATA